MLFITNREPVEYSEFKEERPFMFDYKRTGPCNGVFYCERTNKEKYREIGSDTFMQRLKESKSKQLLLFIHGFSNLPEPDIFPRVKMLQKLFDEKEEGLVEVVPLIWPCDNDFGIVKDYWDDQKAADLSAVSFARVLNKFMKWREKAPEDNPCLKRINILAHSMGNRVLRETLSKWNKYDLANGVPLLFRNTFLMASDIVNESLEPSNEGYLITQASRNVSVYFASDDLALRASKISNLKNKVASRRLGHSGPENMTKVRTNVYAIDCDNFNNTYDNPKGHSYFLRDDKGMPGKVFEHLYNSINTGRIYVTDKQNRSIILE
ncbi:alpha/beta hydrolase [Labilibacter sediminis]|nr:alpha/beta hydrolase [Labilibacter sediminis]